MGSAPVSPTEMTRIDAHQHFWKYSPAEYGWITNEMSVLQRDALPENLQPLLGELGFAGCVAVQARQSLEETRWLLELARQNPFVRGVVGWVDLRSPDLSAQLEQFGRSPQFVGVRHVVQDEPDDAFMLREDFQRGIAQLAEFGLAYDILVRPPQLRAAVGLVRKFPEQRFVLDHIAKPLIAEGAMEPWASDLRELAQAPNVYCKLSGMVTEARWDRWSAGDFRPYLDVVFEAFGPQRLMIGSDWPVCTLAASYKAAMQIVIDYVTERAPEAREAVLGANCARFYRLP